MYQIALGIEEVLSQYMNERCGTLEAFTSGRGVGVVDADPTRTNIQIVAGVWFESFNGANMNIHVAADTGVRWLSRQLLSFVFQYAFVQVGARRLTGLVAESNVHARRFDERLGFKYETRLKDAAPDGDLLVYVMRREDCRWLNLRCGLPPLARMH